MMDVVQAQLQTISSLKSLGIEFYQMPNGNYRIGMRTLNRALGYKNNGLDQEILSEDSQTRRRLNEIGFTPEIERVEIPLKLGHQEKLVSVLTLSFDDFNRLIFYEASTGNKRALEILLSLAKLGLNAISLKPSSQELGETQDYIRTLLDTKYEAAHHLIMEHMKIDELEELETEDDILSLAVCLTS
ncbi:hypothetical protein [Planktothrix pseudagardhii]|uniref:Uncharacterized protein n=1 Tax=Planktothrix pseudagardhii TaxID=132604 RepID=A0A9W4CXZ2_9CYAN|nr:hypothetical protein [Planktothrix pseudagardhii]CAD5916826.1 hypothetical protein NO713_00402 [Planktothrix pseudagardhii]